MMRQCNACGGVYAPIQADGTEYYHVCPPLYEFVNTDTGEIVPRDVAVATKDGSKIGTRELPRPNHRDENVVVSSKAGAPVVIRAEGAGVTELA
jgi:hypothetical protein